MTSARREVARLPVDLEQPQNGAVDEAIDRRIASLTEWLEEHAPEIDKQRHLDEGSRERAYWHYGYLMALRDLRDLLRRRSSDLN